MNAKARKSQETMLTWLPSEIGWYVDPHEAIVFYEKLSFQVRTILEKCAKPWICPTKYVYGCYCYEIMPVVLSAHIIGEIICETYQDVRVPLQCQKNTTMKTIADRK